MKYVRAMAAVFAMCACLSCAQLQASDESLAPYRLADQLEPIPEGTATLYRAPWRSNCRTVAAWDALQGIGVYYKHVPPWSVEQHVAVMRQMVECGVKRLRLAPHHAMYLHEEWTSPSSNELSVLRNELTACRKAGIRPCVTFVHIPAMGTGLQMRAWMQRNWNKGLMPLGDGPGSREYRAYFEKVYLAMRFILDAAKEAGFRSRGSYDLEMGQNLWWGAPALPPYPGLELEMLRPGGQIYEFERALIERALADGYREPVFWDSQSHHIFEKMPDENLLPNCAGRAISFYSPYAGTLTNGWTGSDDWPRRPPLRFLEGNPPELVLAKPEGFMADFCRHDNLIQYIVRTTKPVAIPSLGVVPADIPNATAAGRTGWEMKSAGLARILAFWLNQGAAFVLLHSAYEGKKDEMSHALIPYLENPPAFRWQDSMPLATLHNFTSPLQGARRLKGKEIASFDFRFRLDPDPVLIPATGDGKPSHASDLLAILPFQISRNEAAIAVYVVTPNIAVPLNPLTLTLEINRPARKKPTIVDTMRGTETEAGKCLIGEKSTTLEMETSDTVRWIRFSFLPPNAQQGT